MNIIKKNVGYYDKYDNDIENKLFRLQKWYEITKMVWNVSRSQIHVELSNLDEITDYSSRYLPVV